MKAKPGEVRGASGMHSGLAKAMQKFATTKQVYVGLPAASGSYADGTPLVAIGAINEFGSSDGRIPERSFLRVPLRQNGDKILADFTRLIKMVQEERLTMAAALDQIGARAASISQEAISAGIDPANAPATIKRKGSSTPLVDTGRLRQSITWVVRDKRE